MALCRRVGRCLQERGLTDLLWVVGGNIPRQDHAALKELGVAEVFAVGSPLNSIVDFIREKMS